MDILDHFKDRFFIADVFVIPAAGLPEAENSFLPFLYRELIEPFGVPGLYQVRFRLNGNRALQGRQDASNPILLLSRAQKKVDVPWHHNVGPQVEVAFRARGLNRLEHPGS